MRMTYLLHTSHTPPIHHPHPSTPTHPHPPAHINTRTDPDGPGRTRTDPDGPGWTQTVQKSSGLVKIRLLILYSESYTIIGDFCPIYIGIFWSRRSRKSREIS